MLLQFQLLRLWDWLLLLRKSRGKTMSKKRLERIIKLYESKDPRKIKQELKDAEEQAKNEKKLIKGVTDVTKNSLKIAGPAFAVAGHVISGISVAAKLGADLARGDRAKWITRDKKELKRQIANYSKKKFQWRKRHIVHLLREYDKHLSVGNKKTMSLIDGDLRNKEESNWRAKKAKLEMKIKAIYAVHYARSYKKLMKGLKTKESFKKRKAKETRKQRRAKEKIIKRIKRKQANSIDPRTSPFPLLKSGDSIVTPKRVVADALQSSISDVGIIKLAKMNPNPSAFVQINQSHNQAVTLLKAPKKDLPQEVQPTKKDSKAVIIGVSAVSALAVIGLAVALAKRGE